MAPVESVEPGFWQDVFTAIGLTAFFVMFVSIPLLRLTLDRRVRKTLPPDKLYISFMDSYFGFGRTVCFGATCVFDFANNSEKLRYHYNNVDVRSIATPFDKLISYCLILSLGIIAIFIPINFIAEYFGFFVWPEPVEY